MKKILLLLFAITIFNTAKSQNFLLNEWNTTQGAIDYYLGFQNFRHVMYFIDTTSIEILIPNFLVKSIDSTNTVGSPLFLVGVDNTGRLKRHNKSSLSLTKSQISDFPTNLNEFTNGPGFLTAEIDGSVTNEIELPSQTGNSGKVLTTNGTSPSWATVVLPTNTNLSGSAVSITKQVFGTVTPTTGNGYSINISGAGLTNLIAYSIIPVKNTSTATSVPKIAVKSESTSSIVVNIIEGNNNTVNILGSVVLLGTSEQFVDVTGLTLKVILYGN